MRALALLLTFTVVAGCDDDSTSLTHDLAVADLGVAADQATPAAITDLAADSGGTVAPVHVQVLAINDFHGHIGPPDIFNAAVRTADGSSLTAGGAAYLATRIKSLRAANANTVVVSAGDLTGAAPLLTQNFKNEPAIQVMNALGLDINAVGNHEFDNGVTELLRLQYGGCAGGGSAASCATDMGFGGANFEYLAANVEYRPGLTVFPRYTIKSLGGARVAFIGMTMQDTPGVTTKGATAGLTFDNEIMTVNALVPELKAQGVDSIVVLVHQGNFPAFDVAYDGCGDVGGPVGVMANMMHPAVDAIVSAHTHRAYNCTIAGKLVTSAASYGRVLTKIDLIIDPTAHQVTAKTAQQIAVTRDVTPDPSVNAIIDQYLALTRASADVDEGYTSADISPAADLQSGQSAVGDLIADSMLAATSAQSTQIAFMNPGGVRGGVQSAKLYPTDSHTADGVITFEKLQGVQPFANKLTVMTLKAASIKAILEQQFSGANAAAPKMLQIAGITYHYSAGAAAGSKISQMKLGGTTAIDPADTVTTYVVVTNNFLAGGGDHFDAFTMGSGVVDTGIIDVAALAAHTAAHSHMSTGAGDPAVTLPLPSLQGRVFADP